jgi:ArsR family transcriptional regulator
MKGNGMAFVKNKSSASKLTLKQDSERLATLAKALGHPARQEVIRLLHERQICIGCDFVDEIGLAQSTTSEHLRVLKAAGIITGEIEGLRVCYSLNTEALDPLRRFLNEISSPENMSEIGRKPIPSDRPIQPFENKPGKRQM